MPVHLRAPHTHARRTHVRTYEGRLAVTVSNPGPVSLALLLGEGRCATLEMPVSEADALVTRLLLMLASDPRSVHYTGAGVPG